MRVALIQSQTPGLLPDDRTLEVARELRKQGHEATLVVPQFEFGPLLPAFQLAWQADGFACIPVTAAHLCHTEHHFPWDPGLATARALTSIVRVFDVAWFFEPSWAMPALRERRFRDRPYSAIRIERAGCGCVC